MEKHCDACDVNFSVGDTDRVFLARYGLPDPTRCPDCRQQRRAAFRNSRNLYRRSCSATGKPIVSIYTPDSEFKVFDTEYWWSDSWDGLDHGRPFNFSEPFFAQFERLMKDVPRPALFNKGSENSTYTNHAVYNKNCYMCFNAGYCEDTFYSGDVVVKCKDCGDLTNVIEGELLYECIDCNKCYNSSFLIQCSGCNDSRFLFDCRGCANCLLCVNLRNKSYCIGNKQLSKKEYEQQYEIFQFGSRRALSDLFEQFRDMIRSTAFHPPFVSQSAENVVGDYIVASKNVFESFDVNSCEDVRYCYDVWDIKDSMDLFQTMDKAEQQYETHASSMSTCAFFCNVSHENHDIQYADHCFNSSNLFGCVGLKRQKFCVLNQQYSEGDYRTLVPRVVEHMRRTGEYGEFFPPRLSPFGYDETVAQHYFPRAKEQAERAGFRWTTIEPSPLPATIKTISADEVPDNTNQIPDWPEEVAIQCKQSGKLFRVGAHEIRLYKKLGLPIPTLHPDERARRRANLRNPRKLLARNCAECRVKIISTIPLHGAERVVCEACYVKAIL